MQNQLRTLFPLTLLTVFIFNSTPVIAEESDTVLEEVTVTAQRREQNLQEVPISVSVFTGATLDRQNIRSSIDYLALTPNVSFTEDGQTGSRGLGIAIRGINNLVSGENAFVNSVGIYLDEFSVASVPNQVANPNLADMERVEVLRGPQGTFFGRNALGGALNLTTRKPTDEFGGEVRLGGETYANAGNQSNATVILNVPVSDTFRLRGMFYYEDSSGWVKNACAKGASAASCPGAVENNFTPNGSKNSGHSMLNFRLHAAWDATDDLSILGSLYYSDEKQGTDENVPSGILDIDSIDSFGLSQAIDPGTGFWPQNQNRLSHDLPERTDNNSLVGILNVAYHLNDNMVIKSITGFINADLNRLFDNDLVGGADTLSRTNAYRGNSWSSELRLEVSQDSYDFTTGILYASDNQKQDNNVAISTKAYATIGGVGWLPPFPDGLGLALNHKNWDVTSLAFFADYTWHMNDKWDLTAGARYTKDDVTNELKAWGIAPTCCFPGSPGYPGPPGFDFFQSFTNFARPPVSKNGNFSDVSPRFVARYLVNDDVSVYGTISKGYKAGGVAVGNNTNAPGQPAFGVPYKAETLWNYEFGFKSELWNHRIRLNGSVFFLDWSNLQVEAFRFLTPGDLSSNFEQVTSVKSAKASGAELELVVAFTDNFLLTSSIGYLNSEITSDTIAQITGGFEVALKGLDIPKAPSLTFNINGEYHWQIGQNSAWTQLGFIHRDGQYSDIEALTYLQTDGPSPNGAPPRNSVATYGSFPFRTPNYNIVNLRAGFDMEKFSFIAYVQNLLEENYFTGTQENFGVSGFRLRPHPRVLGLSVSYRF